MESTYPEYNNYYTYNQETNGFYSYYPEPTIYYTTEEPLYIQDENTGAYYYVDHPTNEYDNYYSWNQQTNTYEPYYSLNPTVTLFRFDNVEDTFVPYTAPVGGYGGYEQSYFYDEYTNNYFSYSPEPIATWDNEPPGEIYTYN